MFGSLFDDERPAGVMTSVHTLQTPMPPSRRLPCGLSGIENQGATCYLNSLLQTLLYTPEFKEGLFDLSDAELGSLENREKGRVRIIPLQLQRLFARLLLVDQQAASTTELTDSFGWSNNEELQQHDVQELNRILFSAIDSSLVGTSGKDLISHLYHGSTMTEIVCQICGKISEKEEDFLDLNVIVANFSNLQDSLNATFLQSEVMKGKNQYRCSTCCKLVEAKKGLKIQCLPPILTLSLLRFSYDITKLERFKETGKFVFPFEIDMAPYCNKEMPTEDTVYELFSVLIHSGCSTGGHYHAYIRDVDILGKWLQPDEEACSSNGKENNDVSQDPLLLIKAILLETSEHYLPIEFLSTEINKWTGFSWNKKYKSSHGIITKFLQKHSDVFEYDKNANIVHLKEEAVNRVPSPDPSKPSTSGADSIPGSPKETRKQAVMNSLKLNIFDKKKPSNIYGNLIQNWFDFNDSRVSPILVKDIEKQFSGKESAYMLFYRRKSLLRPEEAKGNPKYKIPEKLLKLVEEENSELERLREEYDLVLNTINLQVHLGNYYMCSNGVLEPKLNEIYFVDLTIDKRKLLLDLRDSVSKIYLELFPGQNFIMHTARNVPAGLHLYEELSESQNSESIKDLGITEGAKIFVWDGLQVGGEQFAIGVAHEPILLNISITLENGDTKEMAQGFSKTTTVRELKNIISQLVPLPVEDIRIGRLDLQGEETRLSPMEENKDLFTLSELKFNDGDNIVADNSIKSQTMHRKEVNRITVIVQNCCQGTPTSENGNPQFTELTVELDNTIEELRSLAVLQFNLDITQNFILRKFLKNQSKRPPLHENETVRDNCLVNNSCLTIEEGIPPGKDQITIMFTVGIGIGDPVELEVTVNKNATVQECLRTMLEAAGLSGDSWHLRKTNWAGEPMEQLSLDGMTLEDENVQHGETLLIMEGRLPAKGFLTFSIWLFSTLEAITSPQSMNMNGIHSGIESLLQNFAGSNRDDTYRNAKLGEVEISSDSTVLDLKSSVLTLPALSDLALPSIRCLRLQMLDSGKPGKVLRGHQNTLRKLKIQSQGLAARVLCTEEDLMQTQILLNLCQRIPDTKTYTPLSEFVWDTNKSASPKSLKQAIADCTGCPIHRLVIAKHFPEKCQWLVIDDGTNPKKNARKKRWGPNKSSLRNAPYYLKDGDTIGIKDRLSDPEEKDDFLTNQDIDGQEILKVAAENKRIKRQEDKSPSRSGEWMLGGSERELTRHAKKGGSEPSIRIHVDDFT
ncbi:hypothetical protein JTE90_001081 [Oedothorax gibbosus]|uniref:USP domain-containing protein n=1 Tax=Oedothorax gibbosus TaxID=931172 RepID=A0AAV6UJD2_9ARAC|nr:hypothetical protein JTE90_001081 [Oedothorax gibbosus]